MVSAGLHEMIGVPTTLLQDAGDCSSLLGVLNGRALDNGACVCGAALEKNNNNQKIDKINN